MNKTNYLQNQLLINDVSDKKTAIILKKIRLE